MPGQTNPWAARAIGLVAAAAGLYGFWAIVVCFIGGNFPLTSWHVAGGLIPGLLMLVIGEPLLMTVAYWIAAIIFVPLLAASTTRRSRQP